VHSGTQQNANVWAEEGALVVLTGCKVDDSLEGSGLVARAKGTRVDAKEKTFHRNVLNGVAALKHASVQLANCSAVSSKQDNVWACEGAVVGLTDCMVSDSTESSGLIANAKGTRVNAKGTSFQGNVLHGVAALEHARVQLDKCTVASNKQDNVWASEGAVVGLTGCTVVDSLEGSGLVASAKGTHVNAMETTFQGNVLNGVAARNHVSVQLDKCTTASNKQDNVWAYEGAVVCLTGCTVAVSLEGSGLMASAKGTRVDAKETTFQGNGLSGVVARKRTSMQLDKCTVASNKQQNVLADKGAVVGLTGCTVVGSLEGSGLVARARGTCVDAKETTFQGNFMSGVVVCDHASKFHEWRGCKEARQRAA
jgi:LysM repeat protein